VSYGTLINGLCKIGETESSIRLLRIIEGGLSNSNVVMYNTIIDSLFKGKLANEAYVLYSEMVAKGIISPVVSTYNI